MKGSETNLEKLRKIRKTNCPQRLVWQDKIEALKNDWAIESCLGGHNGKICF